MSRLERLLENLLRLNYFGQPPQLELLREWLCECCVVVRAVRSCSEERVGTVSVVGSVQLRLRRICTKDKSYGAGLGLNPEQGTAE